MTRRVGTRFDEAAIAERTRLVREAVERDLRRDDPAVTDEAVAEALQRIQPRVVSVSRRLPLAIPPPSHTVTDVTPAELANLARDLPGGSARDLGRRPGLTTITRDEQLRAPIREMRRGYVRVTIPATAARSAFTIAEIRGYLRVTKRTWSEFLLSF